jgi:hypothetical protein
MLHLGKCDISLVTVTNIESVVDVTFIYMLHFLGGAAADHHHSLHLCRICECYTSLVIITIEFTVNVTFVYVTSPNGAFHHRLVFRV